MQKQKTLMLSQSPQTFTRKTVTPNATGSGTLSLQSRVEGGAGRSGSVNDAGMLTQKSEVKRRVGGERSGEPRSPRSMKAAASKTRLAGKIRLRCRTMRAVLLLPPVSMSQRAFLAGNPRSFQREAQSRH